jgi:hypothetical protein
MVLLPFSVGNEKKISLGVVGQGKFDRKGR